jgi:hypothetical protein
LVGRHVCAFADGKFWFGRDADVGHNKCVHGADIDGNDAERGHVYLDCCAGRKRQLQCGQQCDAEFQHQLCYTGNSERELVINNHLWSNDDTCYVGWFECGIGFVRRDRKLHDFWNCAHCYRKCGNDVCCNGN